jgi:hypothetical protein
LIFFRELLKGLRGGTGHWFSQLKICVVLSLAEVLRTEQFLSAKDLRPSPGCLPSPLQRPV